MSVAVQKPLSKKADVNLETDERAVSPYVGLVPFSEDDSEFFFGRVEESKNIAANLRATRLTLVYGPSGVGKSSVLHAGVVSQLKKIAQHDLLERGAPDFAVVFFYEWSADPLNGLKERIREAVKASLDQATIGTLPPKLSLVQIIKQWTERYGIELLIILDQFEEYFLYHGDEDGPGTFAHEFAEAVNCRNLRARFLISMRDDTLAKLDRFKGSIPMLFDNRLQIEHLDLASAYEAIVEPIKKYNKLYAPEEPFKFDREFDLKEKDLLVAEVLAESSPFLIPTVLSDLQVGKMNIGITGQGVVKRDEFTVPMGRSSPKVSIEAPYLQLVMTRIWHDEDTTKSQVLMAATLNKLGGSKKIVEQHLDKIMEGLSEEQQDAATAIFYYLVTPSGTKIAHTVNSLAAYTKLQKEVIQLLCENFLKVREGKEEYRILRQINQRVGKDTIVAYEVYHDALAPAALAWSAKHQNEQDKRLTLQGERKKRQRIMLWGGVVCAIIFLVWGIIYYFQLEHLKAEEMLRKDAQAKEERLISLQLSTEANIKSNKQTFRSLVSLMSGTPEEKSAAVMYLQRKIQAGEIDQELVPLIRPILLQVAQSQPQTQTGKAAAEVANEITQNVQDTHISPRVYIQIQDDAQKNIALRLQQKLNNTLLLNIPEVRARIIAPGIDKVGLRSSIEVSELRYFHRTDLERQIGEQLVQILIGEGLDVQLKHIGGYDTNPNIRPNHFELWLSREVQ